VKARTQAFSTLWGVMIGAPSPLRDELVVLTKRTLVNRCLGLRPETDQLLTLSADHGRLLTAGLKTALRDLALIADLDIRIINRDTGELIRALTLNPAKDYQPQPRKENDVPRHL
jgi:transposase